MLFTQGELADLVNFSVYTFRFLVMASSATDSSQIAKRRLHTGMSSPIEPLRSCDHFLNLFFCSVKFSLLGEK